MTFDSAQLPNILPHINRIAEEAGAAILEVYNSDDFDVQRKGDDSPLTAADLAAHHCIKDGIEALDLGFPLLSEESAAVPFSERESWETYWLIDPLDGTKEFIKRNGEFTVNIALIHQHKAVLGVVYAPVLKHRYSAALGMGASFTDETGASKTIECAELNNDQLRVVGSRSHASAELGEFLEKIGPHELVSMGSSLKIVMVADGQADLYPRIGLTSEWDTAAAQCVVEQAGGQLTKTDMSPLLYNTKDALLNPYFFVFGKNSRDWSEYYSGDK